MNKSAHILRKQHPFHDIGQASSWSCAGRERSPQSACLSVYEPLETSWRVLSSTPIFFTFLKTLFPFTLVCLAHPLLWYVTLTLFILVCTFPRKPPGIFLSLIRIPWKGYKINIFRKEPKLCQNCSLHLGAHVIFEMCRRTQIPTCSKHLSSWATTLLHDLERVSSFPSFSLCWWS